MAKDKFARFMALDALDKSGKVEQLDISVPMRVTFGEPVVLVPETTLNFHKDGEADRYVTDVNPIENFTSANFVYDMVYKVIFDGVEYNDLLCYNLARIYSDVEKTKDYAIYYEAVGSISVFDDVNDFIDTSTIPFSITNGYDTTSSRGIRIYALNSTNSTHTLKIIGIPFTRRIVDERFYTTSNQNPLIRKGKGSRYSCIMGLGCSANGDFSISTGSMCQASGNKSIAGGLFTQANGEYSIAFGSELANTQIRTQANGRMGVAIGYGCIADGNNSRAIGQAVHTNGTLSTGIGDRITANGRLHFAIGKYNTIEEGDLYAFSVGNGTSEEARSNAFTLDWEGNGCYQGKIESQSGVLKLGDTEVTEKQLKALLALLTPTA